MDPRPSWNDYFMKMTYLVAERSTCTRRQVGAVIVKDKHVLATGYNGAPKGIQHCLDGGCLRDKMNIPSGQRQELCVALHAEQNAIIQAAYHGIAIAGSDIYCVEGYPDELGKKLLDEAGLERIQLDHPDSN